MPLDACSIAPESLLDRFSAVRTRSVALAAPLSEADCQLQSMADASPTKWHLAHTTWFFETFVLKAHLPAYQLFKPGYEFLFNSYYNAVGEQYARAERGLISRPSLEEVLAYREFVDAAVLEFLTAGTEDVVAELVELGLNHEQQHQELLLTDIKHAFSRNPLWPAYESGAPLRPSEERALSWVSFDETIQSVGAEAYGFAYDNERPRHRALIPASALASRLVTNAEYLQFIEDGGYRDASLWLSDGWATVQAQQWSAPIYWRLDSGEEFSLRGGVAIDPHAAVTHLSYYEADAFARWAGARLPTEFEWERAASGMTPSGNFLDGGRLHPCGADDARLSQLFGDCWEWTQSAYSPYPGFEIADGAVGEYNGKFMCNQHVLRGGSCVSSAEHLRASYRNFFYPQARWQFSGVRLAKDL